MRYSILALLIMTVCATIGLAGDLSTTSRPTEQPSLDGITVHLAGPLRTSFSFNPDADPAAQFKEVAAKELEAASVKAGGTTIHLDWSRSDKIRDELLWWSVPHHGDVRIVQAEVTGQMVFKPLRELDQTIQFAQAGVSADTPVPVVIVESIKVQLVGPDRKPGGPQPNRELVTAEVSTTEQ